MLNFLFLFEPYKFLNFFKHKIMSFSTTTNKFTNFTITLLCVRLWLITCCYFHMSSPFFSHQSQSAIWGSCGKNCAFFFYGTRFFAKLLGYLIETNKITCPLGFLFFFSSLFLLHNLDYPLNTTLSYLQIVFYTI